MAKTEEKKGDSKEATVAVPAAAARPPQAPPAQQQVNVDDTDATACYANFVRVSSTPEELILDLALNPQPLTPSNVKIKVSDRIILNHYTAKRLMSALAMALQRHEQAFGPLETDIRKRVQAQQPPAAK